MPIVIVYLAAFLIQSAHGATWKKIYTPIGYSPVTQQVTTCPDQYVGVPPVPPYTMRYFCVMKYEAKNDGYGAAVSQASGAPWVSILRATARASCQALGPRYDLISNDQWQTIARNLVEVNANWSGGAVGNGLLSRGHSDNSPASALAASADDNDSCSGTGQTCSSSTWDAQKRTFTLSTGSILWDFAGNVAEWVTNDNDTVPGTATYVVNFPAGDIRQTRYGAQTTTTCATAGTSPYCNLGYIYSGTNGGVYRGGYWGNGTESGIFTSNLNANPNLTTTIAGFRCVYIP